MKQIRENIFQVSFTELGKPAAKGYYKVPMGMGELLLDEADVRYIQEYKEKGYEPSFFISRSALRDAFVVVARQRA